MRTGVLLTLLLACAGQALPGEIVVLTDGTRMEVDAYEVRGNVIVVTTLEGSLRSLPATYVDLEATARANEPEAPTSSPPTPSPEPASRSATTSPPASDPVVTARRALELYGERELFVAMQSQAQSALAGLEGRAPRALYDLLVDAIRRGFDPDVLMERAASRLAEDANDALVADWVRWLESPSVRAINEAEIAADRPESQEARTEFVAALEQVPPAASRERLVARFAETLSLPERSFELYMLGQESVRAGLVEAFPNAPVNEPTQSADELRAAALPRIEEQTRKSLLFKYRDIGDADFERYVAYWESDAGQAIHRSLNVALDDALSYAGQTMGRILGEEGKPLVEAAASGRELASEPQVFEDLNIRFTPPAGWVSLNTETINPEAILGYLRRRPDMYLLVFAEDVGGVDDFTSEAAAEVVSAGLESAAQSYRLVSREPHTVNGLDGLRLVSEASVANQDLTYVQWVCARNGYVFQLIAYAASTTATEGTFFESVEEAFSGLEVLDLDRIATTAAGLTSDYVSERYRYGLRLAGSGWSAWDDLETEAPSADVGGLHGAYSAFMVVPVSLRGLDPSLPVLSKALLAMMDIPYSETTRGAEQPADGRAYDLGYERGVDGIVYDYRLHVRKTATHGYLVAAWTQKGGNSRPRIDALVDGFHVLADDTSVNEAATTWTMRERSTQTQILNLIGLDYLEQENPLAGLEFLEAAFALDPDDVVVLENLVAALARSEKNQEGLAVLEEHLDRFPGQPALASYRPYFQMQLGMTEEAVTNYQTLFANGYQNDYDLTDYAELLWELGRPDEALATVAEYRQDRDSFVVARLEARLLVRNGDSDRALAIFEAQREALPNDIELARQLIDAYYDVEQYEKSRALADELIAAGNATTDLFFRKALGEMALGRYPEAKVSLEAALDLNPGNSNVREHLDYVSGILGEGDHEALRRPIPPVDFPDRLKETPELALPLDTELFDFGAYYETAVTAISYEKSTEFRQTDFYRIRIVDAKALPLFNTFRFAFDPLHERIHVNRLEVRDASGALVLEGDRSDYFVVDDGAGGIASQKQAVSIPVPGLAVGHTISLEVTRVRSSPPEAMPFVRHSFSMSVPVLRSHLYVSGDVEALTTHSTNVPPENVDADAMTWTMERPTVYRVEVVSDSGERFLPFVWITDRTKTWEAIGSDYLNDIRDRLTTDPEAVTLARSLTADSRNEDDRVRAIARYVQGNYTYKAIAFGRAAWLPSPIGQIIENKYGDCKDHTLLFYQLLRALDVPVQLVLIHSSQPVQREVPSLDQFDHMIAFVPSYESGHYFDLTDKGYDAATMPTPLGLGGNVALLLDETVPALVELPDYADDSSLATLERRASIVEGDIDIQETVTLSGYYAAFWRGFLVDSDSATQHRLVQNQLGRNATVLLEQVSADNLDDPRSPLVLSVDYRVESAFNLVDGKLVGKVPAVWERQLLRLEHAEGRKTPYRISYPLTVKSEMSLVAPSGYRISQGTEAVASTAGELVDWSVDGELDSDAGVLRYSNYRSARRGSAAEYEELRRAIDRSLDAVEPTWVLDPSSP